VQAEDGIRGFHVTGVQTCALPIFFTDLRVLPGMDEAEVLRLAASLERGSEHPLAEAIVEAARARNLQPLAPEDFESSAGKGVRRPEERRVGEGGSARRAALPRTAR